MAIISEGAHSDGAHSTGVLLVLVVREVHRVSSLAESESSLVNIIST
jgi:hypothetical protein